MYNSLMGITRSPFGPVATASLEGEQRGRPVGGRVGVRHGPSHGAPVADEGIADAARSLPQQRIPISDQVRLFEVVVAGQRADAQPIDLWILANASAAWP